MDTLLTIFLWLAGAFAFFMLLIVVILAATAASSPFGVILIGFILMIVLVGKAILALLSLFSITISIDNEILLWIFYAFFFGGFFLWLFMPSKKEDSAKEELKEHIFNNIMIDKLKKR